MLERILLSAALIGTVVADESPSEVVYRSMNPCRQGGCLAAVFDKGYFFQMKDYVGAPPDGYSLWDREGKLVYQLDIIAPDGTPGHLRQDAAVDTDGSAIVPISYGGYGGKGHVKGGGIVLVNPAGKQTQFIDTELWLPAHACFALDHSIWVAGTQFDSKGDHALRQDYQLIRKYSRDGKLMGEFLPRSLFPSGLPPTESGRIQAASNRIGVLLHPGMVSNEPEWVELDLNGKLMGRWKLGPSSTGDPDAHREIYSLGQLAFTADARLFAQPHDAASKKYQMKIFDRSTSSWQSTNAVAIPPARAYLVGADGNKLAFESRSDSVQIFWVPLTSEH
jgi:hypothetical protein